MPLLSRYLVHDPQDEQPPLLMTFYLVVLLLVSLSLILIIRNSFAVSMNARIHQFGILSSIGATPGQIRTCLLQEAAALCAAPIFVGSFLGIAASFWIIQAANMIAADAAGRQTAVFRYHPLVYGITILAALLTVFLSAWMPAGKLSGMTPLQVIRNSGGLCLNKKKRSRILSLLFGLEGELAGNALKAQKKALRTSTLSLLLSFLGFTMMMCFFSLSDISTRYTYFERYQDVWDVMVTVKDIMIEDFTLLEELRKLPGIEDSIMYQRMEELTPVPEERQSRELTALGGLKEVAGASVSDNKEGLLTIAPVMVMDDIGFQEYCEIIGIVPQLDGTVVLNRIWDSLNSDFRYRAYLPFVKEQWETTTLLDTAKGEAVELPVLAYTQETPALREEYEDYSLVHFMPLSLWRKMQGQIGGSQMDVSIRILAGGENTLNELDELEQAVTKLLSREYEIESENRIRERVTNDEMMTGFMLILGAFCALLAVIGIANVFSNTLGFHYQRKREFAQYLSVGMTPAGMRRMFGIEALVIAGRPLIITLPLTAAFVIFIVKASHLRLAEFLAEAPVLPIAVFSLAVFGFVAIAYIIGGKRLLHCDLSEALRNDSAG